MSKKQEESKYETSGVDEMNPTSKPYYPQNRNLINPLLPCLYHFFFVISSQSPVITGR